MNLHFGTDKVMTHFSQRLSLSLNLMCLIRFVDLIVAPLAHRPHFGCIVTDHSFLVRRHNSVSVGDKPRLRWMGSPAQRYQACEKLWYISSLLRGPPPLLPTPRPLFLSNNNISSLT